ncbi:hypothetical protein BS78_K033300 [Paspalum vaginatum]|uniref:Uncharacterized protein n=1 Tax=Paspalum vaginatum TaxID=158149 RepID=A0A9W8CEA7_9POAL|nr:hypothetical protein BS78_K033300 [Paspalum vaginatum]
MLGMVGSAMVQEAVSRAVSFVVGKREEAASQGHLMERLEMAANHLEFALEMSIKLPILDVSLLQRRKMIKCAYVQAMELLERHRQQAVPAAGGQEDRQLVSARGQKRKLWMIFGANKNVVPVAPSSSGGLDTADVQKFEQFADWGRGLVQDVESACSLWRNNLCSNPIVRHLLEERCLSYCQRVQGNQRRSVEISPLRSEERGLEVKLWYSYEDDTTPMEGKTFTLRLALRLSASTDIIGVAIKGLQYLASQFKLLEAESAVGELTLLPTLFQGIAPSPVPWDVDAYFRSGFMVTRLYRPDPACCGSSRLGLCSNNKHVSSELSHIFPEEVIHFSFNCYISAAVESSIRSRRSSAFEAGRSSSSSMVGWTPPPLAVSVTFEPHCDRPWKIHHSSHAVVLVGGAEAERRDGSLQQVSQTLKSDAINCFLRQPELTGYWITWHSSRHGSATFTMEKPRIQPTRRRRYNTRGTSRKPSATTRPRKYFSPCSA